MIITLETSRIFSVCIQIIVVSSMFLQRVINESSLKEQWNIKVLEIRSTKHLKIINGCNEIFAVNSMVLQRVINESPMKQQWNISDSEVNTTKTIKFKKVSIEIINVSKCLFKGSSTNHRRSSKETSMSLRLAQ